MKQLFYQPSEQRRSNIHVRIDGNPNQQYALLFHNYLRAHPSSAKSVELIKQEIAKRHAQDSDAYYDIKDPVYDLFGRPLLHGLTIKFSPDCCPLRQTAEYIQQFVVSIAVAI